MIETRGPRKYKVDYGRQDILISYEKAYKGKPEFTISRSIQGKILNLFSSKVSEAMLTEAYEYKMPHRLGVIRIRKYMQKIRIDEDGKLRGVNVDWKATLDLWEKDPTAKSNKKRVFHTNEHSDGYNYKWYFCNYSYAYKNKSVYAFCPSRDNSRRIAELVKDENFTGDYYT